MSRRPSAPHISGHIDMPLRHKPDLSVEALVSGYTRPQKICFD